MHGVYSLRGTVVTNYFIPILLRLLAVTIGKVYYYAISGTTIIVKNVRWLQLSITTAVFDGLFLEAFLADKDFTGT